jgi:DNA helicase-2/ATP-dependent DNA helicase PcrA
MDVFKNLNPKQKEAVEIIKGPSIILAGAGSGKTRVLIHKVLHLIENERVHPNEIVMITFTNKAAREMKDRIKHASNKELVLGYVGTFHSFCSSILRRSGVHIGIPHNFTIYDDDDQEQLLKHILKKRDEGKYTASFFSNRISQAKNQLITPEHYLEEYSFYKAAAVAEVYYQYQKELKNNAALDFDDIIMKTVQLFQKVPEMLDYYQDKYPYLLVDEFQDTNYAQYVLTRFLSKKHQNITVVGDFSQSIYSWRGADIRNLQKFSQDYPQAKVVELEENYRSTQQILDFAYSVILQNQSHPILKLFTNNEKGEDIIYYEAGNEEEEATYVTNVINKLAQETSFDDIAVLYRTNAQSRAIEEVFLHHGIPYTLIGGTRFYERKEIKDVLSYLRLLLHPDDTVATERIKKLGKRRWETFKNLYLELKDQAETLPTVEIMERIFTDVGYLETYDPEVPEDYARLENIKELKSVAVQNPHLVDFLEQVALVESEYFENEKKGKSKNGVKLMTLHQAKGLEFEYVFIVGLEEGILPHSRSIDDEAQLEEERRLFYVGITQAKKKLFITHAKRRFIFGRRNLSVKSRFITDPDDAEITYSEDPDWW